MTEERRFSTFFHDRVTARLVVVPSDTLSGALEVARDLEKSAGAQPFELFVVDFATSRTVRFATQPPARAA